MNDVLITVATAENVAEAALIKNLLEAEGLAAYVANEATEIIAWPLSSASEGVKVQVAKADVRRAEDILKRPRPRNAVGGPVVRPSRLKRTHDKPLTATSADSDAEAPSPRDEDAGRALRAAVIGLILLPFQVYATFLLLKVWFAPQPLSDKGRSRARLAALINLGLIAAGVFIIVAFVWEIINPSTGRLDLKALRHPDRMVGVWQRPLPHDVLGGHEELHLQANGDFRILLTGVTPLDGSGTWGYDHRDFCILYRLDRLAAGDWIPTGKVYSMPVLHVEDQSLRVELRDGPAVYHRRGSGAARKD